MKYLQSANYRTIATLLMISSLLLTGCQPLEKRTKADDVLQDIRNTTVIPDLGSYDPILQRKSLNRILLSIEKAPAITRNLLVATL